jgi:hypothetical protein
MWTAAASADWLDTQDDPAEFARRIMLRLNKKGANPTAATL